MQRLHVLLVPTWVSLGSSSYIPQPQNTLFRLSDDSKFAHVNVGVGVSSYLVTLC